MRLKTLKGTGDTPPLLYGQGVVMNGKHIYAIGGTIDAETGRSINMHVHRFDLGTKKWKQLYNSPRVPEARFYHAVIYYKGEIYVFGGQATRDPTIYFGFSVSI